jgi:hypothetical protein
MKIIYVPKDEIYPMFGWADKASQVARIREDLPDSVRRFVTVHETYHLKDNATWWLWREIKANAYAAWKHPWGFILCCLMSLAPYRLKYYWNRVVKGE